jgi:hypothetical protein
MYTVTTLRAITLISRFKSHNKAALVGAADVFLLQHVPCIVGSGHNGVIVEKQYDHPDDPVNNNEDPTN